MNTIQMTVGDWSDDGHGKVETFVIVSNWTKDQIFGAYKTHYQDGPLDLGKQCEWHEDSSLSPEFFESLTHDGFKAVENVHYEKIDGSIEMTTETFVQLWLDMIKYHEPNFSYEFIHLNNINIGGYGLFS